MPNAEMLPECVSLHFDAAEVAFFSQHTGAAQRRPGRSQDEVELLRSSAVILELFVMAGCALEVTEEELGPMPESADELFRHLKAQTGIDPERTLREAQSVLVLPEGPPAPAPDLAGFVRTASAVLELCPVDGLEALAATHGLQDLGHRTRIAYDALRAFVQRRDPRQLHQAKIIGNRYMEGALSLMDAAALLDMPRTDAVHLLETLGYSRPIEAIRLTPEERSEMLVRIRRDRLVREGNVEYSSELIDRTVIASERLEGVDVRGWMRTERPPSEA